MKGILTFLIGLFLVNNVTSQELNCQVSIITDAKLEITSVEREALKDLENVIYEFMNNTSWTKDKFEIEERINCNIQLQINSIPTSGTFKGSMQVQSSRPAMNSNYNTTVFNFQDDDVTFGYSRGSFTLRYTKSQYTDNLSSMLSFYAFYILGMDYDSFSSTGGSKYLSEAQEIVLNAQSSGAPGWKSNERGKNNRYWLVDNALHQLFSPLRECMYIYHRKGIDKLYDDKKEARTQIKNAISKLVKVTATRPNSLNVLNFIQAKSNEIINLYEDADAREKNEIVNLLKRVDPTNSSKYQEILN